MTHLERASLLAMGAGLLCIVQPWVHALFALGFPLVLGGVAAYNASAFLRRGEGEEA
jgi:hypothetical protein